MFTKLKGVTPDQIDQAIDAFTDADWHRIYNGYIEVAAHELGGWWKPMLGLAADVDVLGLLCRLYCRSITRDQGVRR